MRWSAIRFAALALWAAQGGCLLGDHFFHASGRVVDCTSLSPIVGVNITINVDRGDNPGPYPSVYTTNVMGEFNVRTAIADGDSVTLTFRKAGYVSLSSQFNKAPNTAIALCMSQGTDP